MVKIHNSFSYFEKVIMSINQSIQQAIVSEDCAKEVLVESLVIKDTEDPKLKYRREVEEVVQVKQGEISSLDLKILDVLRARLGISMEEAFNIRNEVLSPYQDYKKRLNEYRRAFVEAVRRKPLLKNETRNGLKRLQELLNLKDEDVKSLEEQILQKRKDTDGNNILAIVNLIGMILLAGVSSWVIVSFFNSIRQEPTSQNSANSQKIGIWEQDSQSASRGKSNNSKI